nr:cytohesin-4 isoform X2 [Meriones unguiculatus]
MVTVAKALSRCFLLLLLLLPLGCNTEKQARPFPQGLREDPAELSSGEAKELQQIKWHRKQLLEDIQKLKDEIADVFAQMDCFESTEESRMAQKEKEMCIGRKKFNMDPDKGIQYLVEHNLLTSDVQDIARFLYKGDGLSKTAIGTYLGEKDPINLQVLQAFVDCHEFANLNLVQALRQFLWSFRLPGEAQKIDRMMEAFAARYCLCNPGVFRSTDTCYVLSFSVIMLNTGLHNPNVRDRPPFERFVSMNRGINNGSDLPEEQLRNLFDSIKSEPFSIPEDDGGDLTHTFFNPDREGWLLKLGQRASGDHPTGEPLRAEGGGPQEAVLPGAVQPQLPGPEDKGVQDRWGRQSGGGETSVLPHLSSQCRRAGPVDRGHQGQHDPSPLL